MHIPDGYISPATAMVLYGAAVPFWWRAGQAVKRILAGQAAPLLAIMAAFVFTIQMFNIPVPGGTTAHAVGGTLVALVLGPWAAVIAVSVALIVQALFFGDGGITAIGANCFNMAVALPFVGYGVYRLLAGTSPLTSTRRVIAAAVGGYCGINVAGLLVGIQLGIQPIFWSENGQALYSPYGLEVAVPTMLAIHLTVAGLAEALATGLVVAYLQRTHVHLLAAHSGVREVATPRRGRAGLTVAVAALVVLLTPLGMLAAGDAWGEWTPETVQELVGYVPAGFASVGATWSAPVPGYQLPSASEESSVAEQAVVYVLSAVVGIALVFVVVFGLRMLLGLARPGPGERTKASSP